MKTYFNLWIMTISVAMLACLPLAAEAKQHRPHYDRPGQHVRHLPPRHTTVRVHNKAYYYHRGSFYQPGPRGYIVVGAPIGARIHSLPAGYISFGLGNRRYFYLNTTYYLWNDQYRDYVVVEKPQGADEALSANTEVTVAADLYVYPRQGQTEEQRDEDRYRCHRWAKTQTGYDPSLPKQPASLAPDYRRAISACLEGRGYTVR